jgi:di/tricarboxylate transporter
MTMAITPHTAATLLLTAVALVLFAQERIRLETASLAVFVVLVLGFTVVPFTADDGTRLDPMLFFSGFGHPALIAICALMVLGKGIERTGALKPLAKSLTQHWRRQPRLTFLATLAVGGFLSGFLNNTPIVILLVPVLIVVALDNQTAPSKILMPLGLMTIIGGMATTIGTSTNLLVVSLANDLAGVHFAMFDFALPVTIVGGAGLFFLWLVAPWLLPERKIDLTDTQQRVYNAVLFLSTKSVGERRELRELLEETGREMRVHKIMRGKHELILPLPTVKIRPGDGLFITGTAAQLKAFETRLHGTLSNVDSRGEPIEGEYRTGDENVLLAEVLVTPGSVLHNRSLTETRFAERFGVVVLALHRMHRPLEKITTSVKKVRLQPGDILLVQGERADLDAIPVDTKLLTLESSIELTASRQAPAALAIMAGVVAMAATGLLPIAVSAVTGVGLMVALRCITWRDLTAALSIPVILIIVVSLALGRALVDTGGTEFLAHLFVSTTAELPTVATLGALIFLMSLVTNVVSNAAAAVVGTPIAAAIAREIGAPVEPFILAVMFGANMSYATPIGYQTNLLILSAGGYKFSDFLRVGLPLTALIGLGFTVVLAVLYGL